MKPETQSTKLNDVQTFITPAGLLGKVFKYNDMKIEVVQPTLPQVIAANKTIKTDKIKRVHFLRAQCTKVNGTTQTIKQIEGLPAPVFFKINSIFSNLPVKK